MNKARQHFWSQQFVNEKVYELVETVTGLTEQVAQLTEQVAELKATKADRRGRKPTGGVSPGLIREGTHERRTSHSAG